jgi:hypothetical protein
MKKFELIHIRTNLFYLSNWIIKFHIKKSMQKSVKMSKI